MLRPSASLAGFVATWLAAAIVAADDPSVATILTELQSPCSVAIRPEASGNGYEIYVADAEAGRVLRVFSNKPGNGEDAITGFDSHPNGGESSQFAGPRGLVFIDRMRLVVTSGDGEGRAFVRLYKLADEQTPLTADQHELQLEPPTGDEPAAVRSFQTPVRTLANNNVADMLIVAAAAEKGPAGLWKIPVQGNTLGELALFAIPEPNDAPKVSRGIGLTVGQHGYVVLFEPAAKSDSNASRLKFLNPIDGSIALEVPTDLPAISSLAYSTRTGNLYAAVYTNGDSERDGVYRIDDAGEAGQPASEAVRLRDIRRPTALAFGPDGALYVTASGDPNANKTHTGVLLKFTGKL